MHAHLVNSYNLSSRAYRKGEIQEAHECLKKALKKAKIMTPQLEFNPQSMSDLNS